MKTAKRLRLSFLLGLIVAACATAPSTNKIIVQPDTVSMLPAAWVFSWSPNMPTHPSQGPNGSWYFNFPSQDGVHYLLVPYHANKTHTAITFTYRITGTGNFVSVDAPCRGAGFSVMLERQGDMMTANQEFYRLWSKQTLLVADGQIHTISFPLVWDQWTGVFGMPSQTEFPITMKNLMAMGFTFGGCYAGHGVYGNAKFELLSLTVQ